MEHFRIKWRKDPGDQGTYLQAIFQCVSAIEELIEEEYFLSSRD